MPEIEVTAIPAFSDNYIWLVRAGGNACAVVDPGAAEPVEQALAEQGLELRYVLLTHHHPDHIGGLPALRQRHAVQVFGPADARIPGIDQALSDGQKACLPALGLEFSVIEVPGHTATHIAFHGHGCLFCGDTLFSAGCGRLFEGSAAQMQLSLDRLALLPPETLVYCGHEYTQSNCRFALEVEPGNEALQRRAREVEAARRSGAPTVPSRLGDERSFNPFLRSREEAVIRAAKRRDPNASAGVSTFAAVRSWKDSF